MNTIAKSNIFSITALPAKDRAKALALLAEFFDTLENAMEKEGAYNHEFLSGLKKSVSESRQKKLLKINSLADLR
jgi:hypothetical protein